jgi:hypothetical protein
MKRIESEPVRFYLENQARIEEWAALAKATRDVLRVVIADLGESLASQPPAEGLGVVRDDPSGYGIAAWYRPEWLDASGRPRLAIGLGWNLGRVSFSANSGERPWVGIWRGQPSKDDDLTAAVRKGSASLLQGAGFRPSTWDVWPIYKYLPNPQDDFWNDLGPWNSAAGEQAFACWRNFSEVVDIVLARTANVP